MRKQACRRARVRVHVCAVACSGSAESLARAFRWQDRVSRLCLKHVVEMSKYGSHSVQQQVPWTGPLFDPRPATELLGWALGASLDRVGTAPTARLAC